MKNILSNTYMSYSIGNITSVFSSKGVLEQLVRITQKMIIIMT